MSKKIPADDWLQRLAAESSDSSTSRENVSSRLKSKIYTALIRKQQETGPLQTLGDTRKDGHPLCYFEDLVRITPVGEKAEQFNCCSICHARVLGERVEDAPIWWPHCPYVMLQNR